GVQRSQLETAAQLVATALRNSITDDRGRWLLGPHPRARAEHRLRMQLGDSVRTFSIDRLFEDSAGQQWVVDFKTSRHEGGGLEEFLDEQRKRYDLQLRTYATAFENARLGLYFPLLCAWREWFDPTNCNAKSPA